MDDKGAFEFCGDQHLYDFTATNHGYYSTDLGMSSNWEDPNSTAVEDGSGIQNMGPPLEYFPYTFAPGYGFDEFPYSWIVDEDGAGIQFVGPPMEHFPCIFAPVYGSDQPPYYWTVDEDGASIKYVGPPMEYFPYIYSAPGYGFDQSPYNPYYPYTPNAMIDFDDPAIQNQQFYSAPIYQNPSPAPSYVPFAVEPSVNLYSNCGPWPETDKLISNEYDGNVLDHNHASGSMNFTGNPPQTASDQKTFLMEVSEVPECNTRLAKQQEALGNSSVGSVNSNRLQGRRNSGFSQDLGKGKAVLHHFSSGSSRAVDKGKAVLHHFNSGSSRHVDKGMAVHHVNSVSSRAVDKGKAVLHHVNSGSSQAVDKGKAVCHYANPGSSQAVDKAKAVFHHANPGSSQAVDKGKAVIHHVNSRSSQALGRGKAFSHHVPIKFSSAFSRYEGDWHPHNVGKQDSSFKHDMSNNILTVKAYTTRAGYADAQGNIVIYKDQYNKKEFAVDYSFAKFFVIKSNVEDNVHKSIKYNVWTSTTNGNKKLEAAYEDAQQLAAGNSGGCPVFLFFSVNSSGCFCGVAEMIGPVDFQKDMDFWSQDNWTGCFPVKWHFVKHVPNIYFKHIILENNENNVVTYSRDTQEILFSQGIEMLKIFKDAPMHTSIFDYFMHFEHLQKVMMGRRAKLSAKSLGNPEKTSECMVSAAALISSHTCTDNASTENTEQIDPVLDLPLSEYLGGTMNGDPGKSSEGTISAAVQVSSNTGADHARSESTEHINFVFDVFSSDHLGDTMNSVPDKSSEDMSYAVVQISSDICADNASSESAEQSYCVFDVPTSESVGDTMNTDTAVRISSNDDAGNASRGSIVQIISVIDPPLIEHIDGTMNSDPENSSEDKASAAAVLVSSVTDATFASRENIEHQINGNSYAVDASRWSTVQNNSVFAPPSSEHVVGTMISSPNRSLEGVVSAAMQGFSLPAASSASKESTIQNSVKSKYDNSSISYFGSLSINPRQGIIKRVAVAPVANTEPVDTDNVGSLPVRINRSGKKSGSIAIGTIPLDIKTLCLDREGASVNGGS